MMRPAVALALLLSLAFSVALLVAPGTAAADEAAAPSRLVLILDASGSMWGQIEGENKIVIARRVLGDLIGELPDAQRVGLIVYGHRSEGDCADIEVVQPIGPLDRDGLRGRIDALNPKGKTPLAASAERAFDLIRASNAAAVAGGAAKAGAGAGPATVILVSDGLETCDGDPCAVVRSAREEGLDFKLHVVGFGLKKEETAQLECAAQAGGGQYLPADNAEQLALSMQKAFEPPPPADGVLRVAARAEGKLIDAAVKVRPSGGGPDVAGGRTYDTAATNPRVLELPAGTYDVEVMPTRIRGAVPRVLEGVVIEKGSDVSHAVDFSSGELVVGITANGALSDASVRVRAAGGRQVAACRTYEHAGSNPCAMQIPAGVYDVEIQAAKIHGPGTKLMKERVEVPGGESARIDHEFVTGVLVFGVTKDGALADGALQVYGADGKAHAAARTYTADSSNPARFVLTPGTYRVTVQPVRIDGADRRTVEVEVVAGGEARAGVAY